MESTTTSVKTIAIEGMTGDACCQKVKKALGNISGLKTESVKVGSATVHCENQGQFDQAATAINGAGFTATAPHGSDDAKAPVQIKKQGEAHTTGAARTY